MGLWNQGRKRALTDTVQENSLGRAENCEDKPKERCISLGPDPIESMDFKAEHVLDNYGLSMGEISYVEVQAGR